MWCEGQRTGSEPRGIFRGCWLRWAQSPFSWPICGSAWAVGRRLCCLGCTAGAASLLSPWFAHNFGGFQPPSWAENCPVQCPAEPCSLSWCCKCQCPAGAAAVRAGNNPETPFAWWFPQTAACQGLNTFPTQPVVPPGCPLPWCPLPWVPGESPGCWAGFPSGPRPGEAWQGYSFLLPSMAESE